MRAMHKAATLFRDNVLSARGNDRADETSGYSEAAIEARVGGASGGHWLGSFGSEVADENRHAVRLVKLAISGQAETVGCANLDRSDPAPP